MKTDFISQLQALGLRPQEPAPGKIMFEWTVPLGANAGKRVLVGTLVNDGFPGTCPTPPHFKPLDDGWKEHPSAVHQSDFGNAWTSYPSDNQPVFYQQDWRYWSRPCNEWGSTEKTAKIYLAHLKKIMLTV